MIAPMQGLAPPAALHLPEKWSLSGANREIGLPLTVKVIIISIFLPEGLSFYVAGLRLTVTRLIFLVVTPVLVVRLSRMLGAGRYRFVLSDLLVPVAGVWMFVAPAQMDGAGMALTHGGPDVLEFGVGYMATRVLLSEHGQALSFANLLCFTIIASGLGMIMAFTSAGVLSFVLGTALLVYSRILAGVSLRWFALIAAVAAGIATVFIVSNNPWTIIARYLIFDPESGYDRINQWHDVSLILSQSPWFGLGFPEFWTGEALPASIDNNWLYYAVAYGIPGSILIGFSTLGATSLPTSGPGVNLTAAECKLGTTLSIVLCLIVLVGFTVYIWGTDRILCGLLMGVRAHLGALGRLPGSMPGDRPKPRSLLNW